LRSIAETRGLTGRLQALLDGLADEIGRTVTVDDERFHYLAYAPHQGHGHIDLDPFRVEAILQREVPALAKEWVQSLHLERCEGPTRVPANPGVGAEIPRLLIPLRWEATLLGYLTLTDPAENPVTESDIAAAVAASDAASQLIYHQRLVDDVARGRRRELLRDLLSDDRRLRAGAVRALRDEGSLPLDGPVAILVLRPTHHEPADSESLLSALHRGLDWLERHSTAAFGLVRADHATVLASARSTEGLTSLGRSLIAAAGAPAESPITVGISAPLEQFDEMPQALAQGLQAACVAAAIRRFAPVAHWGDLGVYAMLPTEVEPAWKRSELDPGYRRLQRADPSGVLTTTLETYLDLGCHAAVTSRALNLHRAGLYYRLKRIEELSGRRLNDGENRLALHLSIKLERLSWLGR
jgi:sugar diacid utilization regulator